MGKINLSRVIMGGIVAGLVANILEYLVHDVMLKAQHEEAMKALGRTMPTGNAVMVSWLVYGFVWGIAAVWLYAAIRPRYGAGVATAARAAVAVWFFNCVLAGVTMSILTIMPLSPPQLVAELVVALVATTAGAALYKEA